MSAISMLNPKAEVARAAQAFAVNVSAAKGIQDVLKTNLGPKGTLKMLVSGAGDVKVTKDGNVLLHEMQIQHPTASLIAKASTAQDDITGDGTTSTVLLIGELLKQSESFIGDGLHPRLISDGFEIAKEVALQTLEDMKISFSNMDETEKNKILHQMASTCLHTKIQHKMAAQLADICVDAVLSINPPSSQQTGGSVTPVSIDLHMVELMEMEHRTETDTTLVKGLVLDHGGRHPNMPRKLKKCFILTCNVSLEYEKSEVNSGFFYKSAEERDKLVIAERQFIQDRLDKVLEFKRKVCTEENQATFVMINQKGIDPLSLDALAKEGVLALRRAKRRNMERLVLACGGLACNSFDELDESMLGYADDVYEHILGEEKYTFVEGCRNPKSVTILLKAPTKYSLVQLKDAVRDGLRGVKNALEDGCVISGAGAFEAQAHCAIKRAASNVKGKARIGVQVFADAMLIIPKTIVQNAGYDPQESVVNLISEVESLNSAKNSKSAHFAAGLDASTGQTCIALDCGIVDCYRAKKQSVHSATVIASNLLLVDEIMRAGMSSLKG